MLKISRLTGGNRDDIINYNVASVFQHILKGRMTVNQSTAKILNDNRAALGVTASAARMSTQQGTALEIFKKSGNVEKDLNLVSKVLSSGHKSVIEHQTLSVAFNDVSVMVEQFVIEFRLASFTVKSRRYVDFSGAGYVVPCELNETQRNAYCTRMDELFRDYETLLERGIPKEDARFLFPYSLRSNFFMTINARELIYMICSMVSGRGAGYEELHNLGEQLKAQFDALYPGVIDAEQARFNAPKRDVRTLEISRGGEVSGHASLISSPENPELLLETAMAFSGRFTPQDGRFMTADNIRCLRNDSRPRELETLNYTFRVSNVSLACVTHFTRHRMQSPMIPDVVRALCNGNYIIPASVKADPMALELYCKAFEKQTTAAQDALESGVSGEVLAYYAMSGHVVDIMMTLNAREMLLFAKLRTCTRAQWEIRGVAREMILRLNEVSPEIFGGYGPSCAVTGRCPEGKMTCGRPVKIENGVWTVRGEGESCDV